MAAEGHEPSQKKRRTANCYGCRQEIYDQYILQVSPDMEWHASCLKCVECHQFLDESCTCFVKDRKTYCKRDYLRLFGAKCAKCSQNFNKNDFVMRARNNIYHTDCFCCVVCSRQLVSGDEFALREDGLFCKSDHEVMIEAKGTVSRLELSLPGFGHSGGGRSPSRSMGDINGNSVSPGSNSNASSTGQLQLSGNSDSVVVQSSHGRHHRESSRHGHGKGSEHKPTRVRTVLNEKQLLTLRTCYNANPRPDALMKEQLVDMTGLSPRVIRVWFQNKRCKDKKRNILMKQMAQQEKDGRQLQNIVNMRGVPLVAGSPMRHESPVQHGLEVQSYHPPWKTFADYAMQPDMDPNGPHFQHLVSQMHGYDHHHMPPGPPPGSEAHLMSLHGNGPPNGPCTPLSYLEHDLHNPHSNLSSQIPGSPSELSSPCTSE